MKIAIVTDAWHPQINGVVRTLGHTGQHLQNLGHKVLFITPEDFSLIPARRIHRFDSQSFRKSVFVECCMSFDLRPFISRRKAL